LSKVAPTSSLHRLIIAYTPDLQLIFFGRHL
jgi:hypothetical protein